MSRCYFGTWPRRCSLQQWQGCEQLPWGHEQQQNTIIRHRKVVVDDWCPFWNPVCLTHSLCCSLVLTTWINTSDRWYLRPNSSCWSLELKTCKTRELAHHLIAEVSDNQTNQTNQTNKTNKTNKTIKLSCFGSYFFDLFVPFASTCQNATCHWCCARFFTSWLLLLPRHVCSEHAHVALVVVWYTDPNLHSS